MIFTFSFRPGTFVTSNVSCHFVLFVDETAEKSEEEIEEEEEEEEEDEEDEEEKGESSEEGTVDYRHTWVSFL